MRRVRMRSGRIRSARSAFPSLVKPTFARRYALLDEPTLPLHIELAYFALLALIALTVIAASMWPISAVVRSPAALTPEIYPLRVLSDGIVVDSRFAVKIGSRVVRGQAVASVDVVSSCRQGLVAALSFIESTGYKTQPRPSSPELKKSRCSSLQRGEWVTLRSNRSGTVVKIAKTRHVAGGSVLLWLKSDHIVAGAVFNVPLRDRALVQPGQGAQVIVHGKDKTETLAGRVAFLSARGTAEITLPRTLADFATATKDDTVAEVSVGSRTFAQYLLRPLTHVLKGAFHEPP